MLASTYVHIQGIGYSTEKKLWDMGAVTWKDFLRCYRELVLPEGKKAVILSCVEESIQRLSARDHRFFARTLSSREQWRAFSDFHNELVYLDIETTGCSQYDAITVIGLYDGREVYQFVRGVNMDQFPAVVSKYKMLVTFFGSGFDLPFIRRHFPDIRLDQIHVDLCYLLRRLGLSGGLKRIEQNLGIWRRPEVQGLDGYDAVRLWNEYRLGSDEALELLLLYNEEDIANMKPLLEYGYSQLVKSLGHPALSGEPVNIVPESC